MGYRLLSSEEMGGVDPDEVIALYNQDLSHAIYIVAPQKEFNYSVKWMVHEKNEALEANDFMTLPDTVERVMKKRGMGDMARHLAQHFLPIREEMIYTTYFDSLELALRHVKETYGLDYEKIKRRSKKK